MKTIFEDITKMFEFIQFYFMTYPAPMEVPCQDQKSVPSGFADTANF